MKTIHESLILHLEHFEPDEFGEWFEHMDVRLLVLLDSFRHQWGAPVRISPAEGALGRELGADVLSDHNVDRHGVVLAADVMPEGMNTHIHANRAIAIAEDTGFSAIGVYPDWRPYPGLHLGTRRDRKAADPANWGALRVDGQQVYFSQEVALLDMRRRTEGTRTRNA